MVDEVEVTDHQDDRQRKLTELGRLLTGEDAIMDAAERVTAEAEATTIEARLTTALTAEDRCDSCGARATHSIFRMHALSVPEFLLCTHHTEQHRESLTSKGWTIAT